MDTGKSLRLILNAVLAVLGLGIVWGLLAPSQLGGRVTYVIVDGNSMEPGFHYGDMVLIQREPAYLPGDAVVYRDPNLGVHVFHRIVGFESDRFILQGDNNSWLDSYRPVQDEIVGRLWLHIPRLGRAINWLRIPINVSLSAGMLGGVMMFDMFRKPSRTRKERRMPASGNSNGLVQGATFALALSAFLFAGLGLFSFMQPLNLPANSTPFQQEGNFFYSAAGTPGVYDAEVVKVGEPIFPKLTCFLNVGLTYNIVGEGLTGIAGEQSMYARIFDMQSGWQRTILLNPKSPFLGASQITTATLDLCQIESLVNLVEKETGVKQINYSLEIVSEMTFNASVNGVLVNDTFSPRMVFTYDKVQFYLAGNGSSESPLHTTKSSSADGSTPQPNSINALGFPIPVRTIRYMSILGLGASLLALLTVATYWYRTNGAGDDLLTRLKYGNRLVNIREQDLDPVAHIIEVASMDDLARLADRHGTVILHMAHTSQGYYFVQTAASTYRFSADVSSANLPKERNAGMTDSRLELPASALHHESTLPAQPEKPKPAASAAFTVKPENAPDGSSRAEEWRAASHKPAYDRIQDYVINSTALNQRIPRTAESTEYVIDTGILECELPERETSVLRTIRLQPCDPAFGS